MAADPRAHRMQKIVALANKSQGGQRKITADCSSIAWMQAQLPNDADPTEQPASRTRVRIESEAKAE